MLFKFSFLLSLLIALIVGSPAFAQPHSPIAVSFSHAPADGEVVKTGRPTIMVYLPLSLGGNKLTTGLWIDGQDVSSHLQRNSAFVSYEPIEPLGAGNHTVKFAMGPNEFSWTFEIIERIRALRYKGPSAELQDFDDLQVELEGTPGCQASFRIEGVSGNITLKETRPGFYSGNYTIPAAVEKISAKLVGELVGPNFYESKVAAPRLRFSSAGIRMEITEAPPEDHSVLGNFTLRGHCHPGFTITARLFFRYADGIEVISKDTDPLPPASQIKAVCDEHGNFHIDIVRPNHHERLILELQLVAEDGLGNHSQKMQARYQSWERPPALRTTLPKKD